jgi:hypothetical protein
MPLSGMPDYLISIGNRHQNGTDHADPAEF